MIFDVTVHYAGDICRYAFVWAETLGFDKVWRFVVFDIHIP